MPKDKSKKTRNELSLKQKVVATVSSWKERLGAIQQVMNFKIFGILMKQAAFSVLYLTRTYQKKQSSAKVARNLKND